MPNVPNQFEAYLISSPIEAEIIAVGQASTRPSIVDWNFKDTPVTLNCDKDKKLLRGMELYVSYPDDLIVSAKVVSVGENSSQAVIIQIGEEEAGPEVGWQLSTRCRWHSEQPNSEANDRGEQQ